MKQKAFRHGEIVFVTIDKLPEGLKPSKDKTFATGSHNHSHTANHGTWYPKQDGQFIIGYFTAKDTSLLHPEHSPKVGDAKLPDGDYEVRKQSEYINGELKVVID